jgi:hypothetical protein
MAWAVERIVEGPLGTINRNEREHIDRGEPTVVPSTSASGGPLIFEYGLATTVPKNWYPLVPKQLSKISGEPLPRSIVFRLPEITNAKSHILGPEELGVKFLNEEELPRTGTIVRRCWKYARWIDGSTHVWIGRSRKLGNIDGSSGLKFDTIKIKS